jgi:hypothetical protein
MVQKGDSISIHINGDNKVAGEGGYEHTWIARCVALLRPSAAR